MTTIGNLSEKGLALFLDKEMRYELVQNSSISAVSGEEIELYIGLKHSVSSERRTGKIFILEEYFRSVMIDLVRDIDGNIFRSYDAIENIEMDVAFDRYAFLRNLLLEKKSMQFSSILAMLRQGIFGHGGLPFKTCARNGVITSCDDPEAILIYEQLQTREGYNFFRDFFYGGAENSESIFDDWRTTLDVYNAIEKTYFTIGYPGMNFKNNIYPEHPGLLSYRWHGTGYSVDKNELRVESTHLYRDFRSWYTRGVTNREIKLVDPEKTSGRVLWDDSTSHSLSAECLYNDHVSTIRGEDELVFSSRYGIISVKFMSRIFVTKASINIGNHPTSNDTRPRYIYVEGRNDGGAWASIVYIGEYLPLNGGKKIFDINRTYDEFRIRWNDTANNQGSSISNVQWFSNIDGDLYEFDAEETTVRYFTDIPKTSIYPQFLKDKHILEELLGPEHCVEEGVNTPCRRFGYGEISSKPSSNDNWYLASELLDMFKEEPEFPPHSYLSIITTNMSTFPLSTMTGMVNYESYFNMEPSDSEAMYSMHYFGGKLGGQTIFNGGTGNEYRYSLPFDVFLEEQRWSIDDFMSIYSGLIDSAIEDMDAAIIGLNSEIRPVDFCEFYDRNHFSQFDNARVYIPLVPCLPIKHNEYQSSNTRVVKKKVIYNQDGSYTIEETGNESLDGAIDVLLNEGEFISSVSAGGGISAIVSDYMTIKLTITLKDDFVSENDLKLRISTSDYTYMSDREFKYVSR